MEFTDRELNKIITSFLNSACIDGTIDREQKIDLEILLKERDPSDWDAVRETLKREKKRFVARLGITKNTAAKGAAGSIDNLLVLINGFVALFAVAALIPVFYIYRGTGWIVPVALFCPAVHFLAFRLARNPDVSPASTKNMHLFAAVASLVPLTCLGFFAGGILRSPAFRDCFPAVLAVLWVAYLILVAILIRTGNGFYCALILPAFVANIALLKIKWDLAGIACLYLALAMFLYCLSGRARSGKNALPPGKLHSLAGFFLASAFLWLGFCLFSARPLRAYFYIALVLYAAALALLPMAMRSESARLSDRRVKNGWNALLAGTCLIFGVLLLLRGAFGVGGYAVFGITTPIQLICVTGALILAWSLLLLYEQLLAATKDFDESVFATAAVLLVACLSAGYLTAAFRVSHLLALLLAAGVFAATMRLRRRYAALLTSENE